MASEDSYSGSETESELSFGAVDFDQIVQEAEARRVLPRESVRNGQKKQKTVTKKRAMLPSNLHSIVIMDKHITQCLLVQDYDYNASLRVVGAALRMQKSASSPEAAEGRQGESQVCGEAPDQRHGLQPIPYWT
jgi:hypothetical protein